MLGNFLGNVTGAILGGYLGNQQTKAYNRQSAANVASANEMSRQIAREQMAFQKNMSDSAFQRAQKDLRKAGLNPILAVSQGGASTPAGASAAVQVPDLKKQTGLQDTLTSLAVQKARYEANTAKELSKQNKMNTEAYEKSGMAPWQAQFSPFNQAGSMAISNALDMSQPIAKAFKRYNPLPSNSGKTEAEQGVTRKLIDEAYQVPLKSLSAKSLQKMKEAKDFDEYLRARRGDYE